MSWPRQLTGMSVKYLCEAFEHHRSTWVTDNEDLQCHKPHLRSSISAKSDLRNIWIVNVMSWPHQLTGVSPQYLCEAFEHHRSTWETDGEDLQCHNPLYLNVRASDQWAVTFHIFIDSHSCVSNTLKSQIYIVMTWMSKLVICAYRIHLSDTSHLLGAGISVCMMVLIIHY